MKLVERRRVTAAAEKGGVTLVYYLAVSEDGFGICIEAEEWGERETAESISPDRAEVEAMLTAFADGEVFPISLYDVVYDSLCK